MTEVRSKATEFLSSRLGVSKDLFQAKSSNPDNFEALHSLEHNDQWGNEARVFALCFEKAREKHGPYKIFGSREVQDVSTCIHKNIDAWVHTNRQFN